MGGEKRKQRREEKRLESRARREQNRTNRAAEAARKQAAKETRARSELEQYGQEVATGVFNARTIRIYANGFVSVSLMPFGGADKHRLISIEFSGDVAKKSAAGRAVGAGLTLGLNLLSSNKRGDLYLTIVTEEKVFTLHSDPPIAAEMKAGKALEAAGNAVLSALAASPSPAATNPHEPAKPPRQRLQELDALLEEGLITREEFDERRRAIIEAL